RWHPHPRLGDGATADGPRRRDREPGVRSGARRDRGRGRPRLRTRRPRGGLARAQAARGTGGRARRGQPASKLSGRTAYTSLDDMKGCLTLVAVALSWLSATAAAQTGPLAAPPPEHPTEARALTGYLRRAWLVSQFQVGVPLLLDTDRDVV